MNHSVNSCYNTLKQFHLEETVMGQVIHNNATTTHAIRKEIQKAPKEVSNYALSKRFGLNILMLKRWRERGSVEDRRSGPQEPRSKSLTRVEEAGRQFNFGK